MRALTRQLSITVFALFLAARALAAPSDFIPLVLAAHSFPLGGELAERVGPAPQPVMDLFAEYDRDIIPHDKPYRAYTPTEEQMRDIRAAIAALPRAVRDTAAPRLLGIYFIENMIGSGWTEWMIGPDRQEYFVIALNAEVLQLNASDWITKKEKTVFKPDDPAMDLRIDIGADRSGFYYIFCHEIAHVYDYATDVTPGEPGQAPAKLFEEKIRRCKSMKERFPFMHEYWQEFRKPAPAHDFEGRASVSFYGLGGPNVNMSAAPELYRALETGPFVTLYASQNWMEDFAELFAAWMSIEILGRPWKLTVTRNGETVYTMEQPLKREPLAARASLMKKILSIE